MAARRRAIRIIPFMTSCSGLEGPTSLRASEAIHETAKKDWIASLAPRNDDGDGSANGQKPQRQSGYPPVNACAAGSASRSTRRRDGPGTIIRPRAGARMARPMRPMSEAGASAFAITKGDAAITRYEDKATKTVRSFCARCGTPLFYERARSPHMVNIPRALFAGRTGRQPLYHIAIEELQEWTYTGEPLVPLKGFPGVVWHRSKKEEARSTMRACSDLMLAAFNRDAGPRSAAGNSSRCRARRSPRRAPVPARRPRDRRDRNTVRPARPRWSAR